MSLQYLSDKNEPRLLGKLLDGKVVHGRYDWAAPTYCVADKYGVAGLKSMVAEHMEKASVCHYDTWQVGDYQSNFMRKYYYPLKEALGGFYPKELYPIFAKALAWNNWSAHPTDKMLTAAMEDVGLNTYLLGEFGHKGKPGRSRAPGQ